MVCMGAAAETDCRACFWFPEQEDTPPVTEKTVGIQGGVLCTDGYRAYNSELPGTKHIVGKLYTQRIERENLTLRNRLKRLNRKTLGYSKSPEMHDRIIGTFIEREYYV